jgi:tripartite-type tricarboxylate transporter receptor subunit TctC
VVAHPILTTNQWLYAQMPFDPEHDFIPVIRLTASPNILLVNSAVPAKTVGQLIELARSKPDSLSYGSGGIGTGPFIAAELLKKIANIDLLHVPYRGSAPAALGLMGGEVQILFDAASTATSHIQTGKVRALATGGRQRIAVLPDVPTMAESGFPDFESVLVTSVVVPAGTPEAIVSKLNADFNTVLSDSEVKTYFNKIGSDVVGGTPQELADFLRTDRAKMGELIKSQGITVK